MIRNWRPLALAGVLVVGGSFGFDPGSARAQSPAYGGNVVVVSPVAPVTSGGTVFEGRRARRLRNRYYAQRPNYAPVAPGSRARVSFEPFTRHYYPNSATYYPPVYTVPAPR